MMPNICLANLGPHILRLKKLMRLEPRLLEQYRALPDNPGLRNKFLTNNLARIQSFRQRVPLRPYLR